MCICMWCVYKKLLDLLISTLQLKGVYFWYILYIYCTLLREIFKTLSGSYPFILVFVMVTLTG